MFLSANFGACIAENISEKCLAENQKDFAEIKKNVEKR